MNNYAYNLSIREENLDRAKELALRAIELDAENAAYLDTVGWYTSNLVTLTAREDLLKPL